ncbi:hydantoinase B/oxoprolinase family protein [Desulfosporosinus shakirovi]|uniref:hydantoinase B/oxoprolinase family protein n=1 Tax=Desulfosporosinus shakirovi TaxID=2885154 RepID=UPI001E6075CB|nr:hydantoinase B/oxoprolinase family protein [Desulfosporosinus sp. SRJS8]
MAPVVEKGRLTAGHFLTVGAFSLLGTHSVTGETFVDVGPILGGWGVGVDRDGDSSQFCSGDGETYNIPAEVLEAKFGYRTEYSLNTNSTGTGEATADLIIRPGGYKGGQDGSPNSFDFIRRERFSISKGLPFMTIRASGED